HYIWVVRSTLAFEEAAVEHAAKLARRIEAVRQGRWAARPSHAAKSTGRIRLRLAPTGGPGVAILWKNTVGATRDLSQRTFILIAVVVIGGSIALASGPMRGLDLVAVLLLGIGGLTLLFGPLAARCDLRQDLEMLDLLKGYPVRGRQVVGGEVAAPVTLIGLVVWSCLLGAFAATAGRQGSDLPSLGDRLAILLALLPATGAVLLVLVLVQNAAVLLFPAWVRVGRARAVGLEATGQRILMTAGSMVVLVVALVPAVVVGGIAGVAARAGGLPLMWAVTVASLMGSAVVLFEGVLAVHLLGGVFDRMDPGTAGTRSEEHTSELQSRVDIVCRLLLEKKKQEMRLRIAAIDIEKVKKEQSNESKDSRQNPPQNSATGNRTTRLRRREHHGLRNKRQQQK